VAFGQLGIADVFCFTLTTNRASQQVTRKAGFRYERDIVHAGLPHVFYRIAGSIWKEILRVGRRDDVRKEYEESGYRESENKLHTPVRRRRPESTR
jgi:RimJ/RimL family protein N-acetyltransferase